MRVDDVPPGWLVIAADIGGEVYCLECRCSYDGEPLSEDDVVARHQRQKDVVCAECGLVFSVVL